MNYGLIFRVVVGIASFLAGFFFVREIIPHSFVYPPYVLELFSGVVLAAVILYLVPFMARWITKLFFLFTRRVAHEITQQLRFPGMLERFERPRFKAGKGEKYIHPMVLDTSAIIDGRISAIAESGFLYGTVIVPRFVLAELQHISDSEETLRRNRGRRGFEILDQMKKNKLIKVEVVEDKIDGVKNVDDRLVKLAKKINAKIITTDFNLNKVASTMDVKVLNVNQLVNAIKTSVLPGEPIEVAVIQEGKERDQGVGYLPDGTMIVVENGSHLVGKKVQTTVSRVLQTVAGRMIFVKTEGSHRSPAATN